MDPVTITWFSQADPCLAFKHLTNARDRFLQILDAGGKRDAHVALGAEGRPRYQRHTDFLEQQVGDIDVIVEIIAPPGARSWRAKFETAKVGDGFIAPTRLDKSLNTGDS